MTDEEKKLADLEAAEKALQVKKAELDKVTADTEEAKASKKTQIEALDKEAQRIQSDITVAKEERRKFSEKETSFQDKLRGENLEAAKTKFFAEFGVKPEDQAKFLDDFKGFDKGSVNADLIFSDMKRTYAAAHADELIETRRKVDVLQQNSKEFEAQMSSMSFAGVGGGAPAGDSALSPEDIQAAQWAGIPVEKYKELRAQGKV